MTSKLVLMGCGALMALTQTARGADAEALSKYLSSVVQGDYDETTIEVEPCGLTIRDAEIPAPTPKS
jgi:hypothetical protein